jgi:beta-fructofuranosidase
MADHRSQVPLYEFPETLAEQEVALAANPLLQRMHAARAAAAGDRYRPVYHYVNPESTLNDPNGICFWKGRWHLFYQGYPPEDPRQHWGHAVSDDLVQWRDLPYAIYPDPERCCFSGTTFVEEDRVIAMYHGTEVGNMVAVSSDPLLLNWSKVAGRAVIPIGKSGRSVDPELPYTVFDPCIWKKGEAYYALSAGTKAEGPAGKPVRANYLFRSPDLEHWEYLHPFVEDDQFTQVGDDGACPYFWPIGDRHILLFFSHMSGGQYLLGDYDTARDKFVVTQGGKFNHGASVPSGLHAPSATPDGSGGLIVMFNMNPGKPTVGWNQIMTLPWRLTVEGDVVQMEPAGDLSSLRHDGAHVTDLELPANEEVVLPEVTGDALELDLELEAQAAPVVELNVLRSPGADEYTRISFYRERGFRATSWNQTAGYPAQSVQSVLSIDTSHASMAADVRPRPPESAQVVLGTEEPLKLRVFVDRSVVEVFANGRQCLAVRVYPEREDSVGVSLRSQGAPSLVRSLQAWQMGSIWT